MALVACKECGQEVSLEAQSCPNCGAPNFADGQTTDPEADEEEPDKSAEEGRSVGWLLGIGIFFMPYIFAWLTLREGHSTRSRVVSLGWMGIAIVSIAVGPSTSTNSQTASTTQEQSTLESYKGALSNSSESSTPETNNPQRDFVDISCKELVKKFGPSSKLSNIQQEEAWKKYDGKAFRYDLEVVEVSEETFGGYQVQTKCRSSSSMVQDLAIKYGSDMKGLVMDLKKGKVYELTGKLNTYSEMTGPIADGFVERE